MVNKTNDKSLIRTNQEHQEKITRFMCGYIYID